jgi:hypothetical protein
MRRHEALQDLSRDHHVLLLHARRLAGQDRRVPFAAAQEALRRFAPTLAHHLAEEELAVARHVRDANQAAERRMLDRDLLALAQRLPTAPDAEACAALAALLRSHVRLHEEQVFPALQARLLPEDWSALQKAARDYRAKARPEAVAGAEECYL